MMICRIVWWRQELTVGFYGKDSVADEQHECQTNQTPDKRLTAAFAVLLKLLQTRR